MARLEDITLDDGVPATGSVQILLDDATAVLPLADVIDLKQEVGRLKKELEKTRGDIATIAKKLENRQFLERAPEEVVSQQRERLESAQAAVERLNAALARMGAA